MQSQNENQRKRKERQVPVSCPRTEKAVEQEGHGDTSYYWRAWNGPERLVKEAGRVGIQRTNRDHLYYSLVEIGQNIGKSPGDLSRLTVTQTPLKNL